MAPERGLHWFERDYRHLLEAEFSFANLDADAGSLSYTAGAKRAMLEAMQSRYPPGHWARDAANYPSIDDLALQLVFSSASRLRPDGRVGEGDLFDACLRVVRSPMVSPYALPARGVVVVPMGFLASIDSFVTTVFELSYVGASLIDPAKASWVWENDRFVLAQCRVAVDNPDEYGFGVFAALRPTFAALLIADAPEFLRAAVFRQAMYSDLNEMMSVAHRFTALGFGPLGSVLAPAPALQLASADLRRLVAAFALCHEMGHLLVDDAAGATEDLTGLQSLGPDRNEALADALGTMIFYRIKEAGLLDLLIEGRPVTHGTFVNAVAAFHAWSLALCLTRVGAAKLNKDARSIGAAMAALRHVAGRWKQSTEMLVEAEGGRGAEGVPGFAETVCASWGFPCGELLRQAFLKKGLRLDCDDALQALDRLDDPDSKVSQQLAKADEPD